MKKEQYMLGGIIAVLVIVLGIVLFKNPVGDKQVQTESNSSTSTSTENGAKTSANKPLATKTTPKPVEFTNIFPSKGNFECKYEEVTPTTRSTNVLYFSDGKMRGEFRTLGGASNIMVYDGRNLYKWIEGQAAGIVSVPKSIADFPPIIPKDITEGKVLGGNSTNVSWDCHAWIKNASLLEKPTYVKFY